MFYLENTLKLVYQSNSGSVSLEKVSLQALPNVLAQIASLPQGSPFAQTEIANQVSALSLHLCAVTWQQSEQSVRIKAIPDAAILRSKTSCFSHSQAVFRHEFLLEHDDLLTPSLDTSKNGVYTYNRVSIEQFVRQIEQANAHLSAKYRQAISVKPDNFDTAFSEHEAQVIEGFLGFDGNNNTARIRS